MRNRIKSVNGLSDSILSVVVSVTGANDAVSPCGQKSVPKKKKKKKDEVHACRSMKLKGSFVILANPLGLVKENFQ